MGYKELTYKSFKIEIERNTDIKGSEYTPFFITINGKRLENVKRFRIDIDREKLMEHHDEDNCVWVKSHPWNYLIEFEDFPDD